MVEDLAGPDDAGLDEVAALIEGATDREPVGLGLLDARHPHASASVLVTRHNPGNGVDGIGPDADVATG
jgi:hypothetical protein